MPRDKIPNGESCYLQVKIKIEDGRRLKAAAKANHRTVPSEVIRRLEFSFRNEQLMCQQEIPPPEPSPYELKRLSLQD